MSDRRRTDEVLARLEEIDREILRSIERRARHVEDLIKDRSGNAVHAPIADGAHIGALERAAQPPIAAAAVRPVFEAIDAACRVFEVAPRVAYAAADGGFGLVAARAHFGPRAELLPSATSLSALDDVARSRADFALVPYESVEEGPAFDAIQAIVASDLKLVGERHVVQALSLVARSDDASAIETIHASTPHHLACVGYLSQSHPRATVVDHKSAGAALDAMAADPRAAAIVPRGFPIRPAPASAAAVGDESGSAAPASDGDPAVSERIVLRESISDLGEVRVRWGVVSRLPMPRTGADATALVLGVHDRPGALHDVLLHFKQRDCNLRRIHSRAVRGPNGWDYLFYAEVGGHATDRHLTSALEGIKREARTLQIVGSFPIDEAAPPISSPPR